MLYPKAHARPLLSSTGSKYDQQGGTSSVLCLNSSPRNPAQYDDRANGHTYIYAAELQTSSSPDGAIRRKHDYEVSKTQM